MVEELRDNNGILTDRFFVVRNHLATGIPVFQYNTKTYYLEPTREVLHHDDEEDPGGGLFTIISDPTLDPNLDHVVRGYEPTDMLCLGTTGDRIDTITPDRARGFSMPLSPAGSNGASSTKWIPCVFIALGLLSDRKAGEAADVEAADVEDGNNYHVILLNLSTDPISVWLIYDYHMLEELDSTVRWTNRNDGDGNRLFIDGDIYSGFANRRVSCLNRYKGFRKHYTNEEDMCPKANHFQTTTPDHKSTSCPLVEEESPAKRSQTSSSSRESADRDSDVESALSSVADDDERVGTLRNTKHHDMCCSDSKTPFDLAMLAPDVDKWDLSNGLDPEEVRVCLHATSMRLGSSMRVRLATEDERNGLSAADKHVDLRAFC